MPRQPILNSAPLAPAAKTSLSVRPISVKQSSFRQGLIAIALGSLCLAVVQASGSSRSNLSASPIEATATVSEAVSSDMVFLAQASTSLHRLSQPASKVLSDHLPASLHPRSSGQMRYVWNRHWFPARTSASTPSFSALEQTWFSWYRWWQLQSVKPRSAANAEAAD